MVKIQKLPSGQLVITIPKVLADYEGLVKGMEIEFMLLISRPRQKADMDHLI